jgi:AraC-like DNA-binding protein
MDLSRLSPYIRIAMDHRATQGFHLRERAIFDYELLYVKEGRVLVTVNGRHYNGEPGDLFLFKPGEPHSIRTKPGFPIFRQPHIHFDLFERSDSADVKISFKPVGEMTPQERAWIREDVLSEPPFRFPNHIRPRNPLAYETMLIGIIDEYRRKTPYYETNLKGMLIQLLVALLRELYWQERPHVLPNMDALQSAKSYILARLDRELTVGELAAAANMSKSSFIRSFKSAFGITPIKYYQMMRIERAKELIQYTSMPITRIADSLGFPSIHAFSRAFRALEGVAPSSYRRKDADSR